MPRRNNRAFGSLPCYFCSATCAALPLSLHTQQERLLERFRHPAQKTRRVRAINQAMIIGERERQNQPRLELSANPFRLHARTRKPKNGNLGMVHNRSKRGTSDAAKVRDGEGAAFHVG